MRVCFKKSGDQNRVQLYNYILWVKLCQVPLILCLEAVPTVGDPCCCSFVHCFSICFAPFSSKETLFQLQTNTDRGKEMCSASPIGRHFLLSVPFWGVPTIDGYFWKGFRLLMVKRVKAFHITKRPPTGAFRRLLKSFKYIKTTRKHLL